MKNSFDLMTTTEKELLNTKVLELKINRIDTDVIYLGRFNKEFQQFKLIRNGKEGILSIEIGESWYSEWEDFQNGMFSNDELYDAKWWDELNVELGPHISSELPELFDSTVVATYLNINEYN